MIKILFLAANPSNTVRLQLDVEVRGIDEALRKGQYRDVFELESHWQVRTSDLQELLLRHQPDIVHFSGHGSAQGAIFLEDQMGQVKQVSPNYLRTLFQAMQGKTRCVVLNACYSDAQAADILEEVGVLIGMTDAVDDRTARTFSAAFYQALAYGQDVQTAFDLGREQIAIDLSPDADVLRLLHAEGVIPAHVRFAEPTKSDDVSPLPSGKASPSPSNKASPGAWWKRPEILVPAITALLVAVIGLVPPLWDRIWPTPTPMPAVVAPAPPHTPTPLLSNSTSLPPVVTPPPLMPETGFNVAVAGFLEETETGVLTVTATSQAISEWLFAAVSSEASQLPVALRNAVIGPEQIPPVAGLTAEERARYGQGFAERNNISLLIYGIVRQGATGHVVEPEFYVTEDSFSYGSEIAGSSRLGQPVPFAVPITAASLVTVNREMNSRTQVLRYIIEGLAYFSIDEWDRAQQAFEDALTTPGWESGEEVVYLLIGATALAEYDPITNRDPLLAAKMAFSQAYSLKPQYARSLLGMGAVLLQEACVLSADGRGCGAVDTGKLQEAQSWYEASLTTTDNQASYFVPLKAAYGLGQVALLGAEYSVPDFDLAQAKVKFEEVIRLGEGSDLPSLVRYVGVAYSYLGRIDMLSGQYSSAVTLYQRSNEILDSLAVVAPKESIARNWAAIGFAEKQLGEGEAARNAYCRAVREGVDFVSDADIQIWHAECNTGG
jgi:tetratricopeptide (TPR) repeat protein